LFTIHLSHLQFFSFHGLHEEEKVLGGEFIVDAEVNFNTPDSINTIEQTIDYTKIYELIKQRMGQPTALLETVAQDLAELIYAMDNRIVSINIGIKKVNPPIAQFRGSMAVCYKKDF
jgi:dihydroneopterin aldolase